MSTVDFHPMRARNGLDFTTDQAFSYAIERIQEYSDAKSFHPNAQPVNFRDQGMPCQLVTQGHDKTATSAFQLREIDVLIGSALNIGRCQWLVS